MRLQSEPQTDANLPLSIGELGPRVFTPLRILMDVDRLNERLFTGEIELDECISSVTAVTSILEGFHTPDRRFGHLIQALEWESGQVVAKLRGLYEAEASKGRDADTALVAILRREYEALVEQEPTNMSNLMKYVGYMEVAEDALNGWLAYQARCRSIGEKSKEAAAVKKDKCGDVEMT